MVAAVLLGVVVLLLDNGLLVAKMFLGLSTLFLPFVGFYLLAGSSGVSSGHLNLTIAAQVRRPLLAFVVIEAVLLVIAYLALIAHATARSNVPVLSLVIGMLVPVVIQGLVVLEYLIARRFLPPRPEVLREHGLSGQVVGPPQPAPPAAQPSPPRPPGWGPPA